MVLLPFFVWDGIFWKGDESGPWIQLGVNIAGVISIMAWAAVHSCVIFGGLKLCNLLRISGEDEFKGCDITKHGESAYPVNAWKEAQYDSSTQTLPVMKPSDDTQNGRDNGGVDNIAMEKFE